MIWQQQVWQWVKFKLQLEMDIKYLLGTGLNKDGEKTDDPILKSSNGGVLLPFGGYKGSAIAMMVELLSSRVSRRYV